MFPNPCLPHVMKIHMQRYALESSDVLSLSRRSPYQLMTIIAYPMMSQKDSGYISATAIAKATRLSAGEPL